jgi:hypothetical protein
LGDRQRLKIVGVVPDQVKGFKARDDFGRERPHLALPCGLVIARQPSHLLETENQGDRDDS